MNKLTPYFPINKYTRPGNLVSLVVTIVIYVVVAAVLGWVAGILGGIPILGIIFRIISTLIWVYEVVGIVLAVLTFLK